MNNLQTPLKIQTTITLEFDKTLRRHAYLLNQKENKVLELYQSAYLRELEAEKETKRLNRELKEKSKINCPRCGSEVDKLLTAPTDKK